MIRRDCLSCGADISRRHPNAKRCHMCATKLVARPAPALSAWQERQVIRLAGIIPRRKLAFALGLSIPSLQRFARNKGLSLLRRRYDQATIDAVVACYEEHGKNGVIEQFPNVAWRTIIEHLAPPDRRPRQIRWTPEQVVMAVKMAGLVPMEVQAKVFDRPRAGPASIKSFWQKRFNTRGSLMHGLRPYAASLLLRKGFPTIEVAFHDVGRNTRPIKRRLVLWCDMAPYVHTDAPPFIRQALEAMSDFQQWLFQTADPRTEIQAIAALGRGLVEGATLESPRTVTTVKKQPPNRLSD